MQQVVTGALIRRWPGDLNPIRIAMFFNSKQSSMGRLRTASLIGNLDRRLVGADGSKYQLATPADPGFDQVGVLPGVIAGPELDRAPEDRHFITIPAG